MSKRNTKPREPVQLAPIAVSQLTCLAVLGIDERRFRETFGDHPKATRVGKLLVLDVADVRDALRSMRSTETANDAAPSAEVEPDDGPRDVDDVLARLGRQRAS